VPSSGFWSFPSRFFSAVAPIFWLRGRESSALAATTMANIAEPVSVTYPQRRGASGDISLPSTLQAYADSPIYARTNGYLAHWYADIGTHVQKGQLLAVIQSPEVDQELNQARGMLSQTQATFDVSPDHGKAISGSDPDQRRRSTGSRHEQPEPERPASDPAGNECEC